MTTIQQLETHQRTVDKVRYLLAEVSLRHRELGFVSDMDALLARGRSLSVKQRAYLDSIYNRSLFRGDER